MAHYATDCWDAEILTSYGWVECVGHADRSCFDLDAHAAVTGRSMLATKMVKPHKVQFMKITLNKKVIGKTFKREAGKVVDCLSELAVSSAEADGAVASAAGKIEAQLAADGKATISDCNGSWEVTREMVNWAVSEKTVQEVKFRPSVVEPSFGIGRIMYSLLEHSYAIREDEATAAAEAAAAAAGGEEKTGEKKKKKKKKDKKKKEESTVRNYFRFKPAIAPIKCALLPLSNHSSLLAPLDDLNKTITGYGISVKVDGSGAQIGRKYARMDEVGVPFAVVVDFNTVGFETTKDGCVTLRERDSMQQIRLAMPAVPAMLRDLVEERIVWADLVAQYGLVGGDAGAAAAERPQLHGGGKPSVEASGLKVESGFSRPEM
jgi:glycyl-tRNA synthetase